MRRAQDCVRCFSDASTSTRTMSSSTSCPSHITYRDVVLAAMAVLRFVTTAIQAHPASLYGTPNTYSPDTSSGIGQDGLSRQNS